MVGDAVPWKIKRRVAERVGFAECGRTMSLMSVRHFESGMHEQEKSMS